MDSTRGVKAAVRYVLSVGGVSLAMYPAVAVLAFSLMVLPRKRLYIVDMRRGPAIAPGGVFLTEPEAKVLFVGTALLVAVPLGLRYARANRSMERLWVFAIAVFVLGVVIGYVQMPLRARLDTWGIIPYYDRSYAQAGYVLLLGTLDYAGSYLLVFGGGYAKLRAWVAN